MIKSRLSMAVTIASHQPNDLFGYFAITYEPTRSVSQGLTGSAVTFSGLPVDAATGFTALIGLLSVGVDDAVAGAEEVPAVAVVRFMFCSEVGFAAVASLLVGLRDPSAPATPATYFSMRR